MLAPDELAEPEGVHRHRRRVFCADRHADQLAAGRLEFGLHAPAEACHQRTVAALRQRRRDVDRGALRAARFQAGNDLQDRASPARRA